MHIPKIKFDDIDWHYRYTTTIEKNTLSRMPLPCRIAHLFPMVIKAIKAQPGTEDLTEQEITQVYEDCFNSPPFPYLTESQIQITPVKTIETEEDLEQHISNINTVIADCERRKEEMSRPHPNALARAMDRVSSYPYLSIEETVKAVREEVEKNRQNSK